MAFDGIRNSALVRTVTDVLEALPDLFRKEIRLAQAEFGEKVKDGIKASAWMIVAGFFCPDMLPHPDRGGDFRHRKPRIGASLVLSARGGPAWCGRRRILLLRPLGNARHAGSGAQRPGSQ